MNRICTEKHIPTIIFFNYLTCICNNIRNALPALMH